MKMSKLFLLLFLMAPIAFVNANDHDSDKFYKATSQSDSLRLAELNTFWAEVSRTVHDGDYKCYSATYHEDAVVVFATGKNKVSTSINAALANWEQGFTDSKAGKTLNNVEFRFSQRIGSETTAHETGIFSFQSNTAGDTPKPRQYIHFEALLVKKENTWLMLMEYQKSKATEEEWDLLE